MQIVMPKLGLTMTEGTLSKWLKAAGDTVKLGEILFEFESEKSVLEFESPAEGVLAHILVAEGETVPCGTPVAVLERVGEPGSRGAALQQAQEVGQRSQGVGEQGSNLQRQSPITSHQLPITNYHPATPAAKRRARELGVDLAKINGRGPEGRIHLADVEFAARARPGDAPREAITPVAKKVAADLEVDWTHLSGSGPGGRIIKDDVLQAAQPAAPARPLSGVRAVIARRMSESAFTAPHVTLFTEADALALVEARAQLNAELAGRVKISYNTLLIAIAGRALRDHPQMNACIVGDKIHAYSDINIALAVDTGRGLLVPVIRQVNRLNLVEIQQSGDELIGRAVAGKSLPDDFSGGTFTISNLGMFEVDGFTPIINQPQAAILGVGRIAAKPVAVNNEVVIRQMMTLSLSFDHRIVDGGPAARFLQRIKHLIERPFALLLPALG